MVLVWSGRGRPPDRTIESVRLGARGLIVTVFVVGTCRAVDPTDGGLDELLERDRPAEIPVGVDAVYDGFLASCRTGDPSGMWVLFSDALKAQVDERAAEARASLSDEALQNVFGFADVRSAFDGTAYLAGVLRLAGEVHPCPDADLWRRVRTEPTDDGAWVMVVQRPDGRRQALRIALGPAGTWELDQLSKPRRPEDLVDPSS